MIFNNINITHKLIAYINHYYVVSTGFIGSNFIIYQQINSTTILKNIK